MTPDHSKKPSDIAEQLKELQQFYEELQLIRELFHRAELEFSRKRSPRDKVELVAEASRDQAGHIQ